MEAIKASWVEGAVQSLGDIECTACHNTHARLSMATTDSNLDDLQSLDLIRQGGKMRDQGYAMLWRKYEPQFRRKYIYRYRLTEAEADEVTQETFLKIARSFDTYNADSPLAAWLWRIAVNCVIDHIRSTKARIPADIIIHDNDNEHDDDFEDKRSFDVNPNDETFEDCVMRDLVNCLDLAFAEFKKHYPIHANAFSLWTEGYDNEEIATAIQKKSGNAREYLSQCKKKIEELLQHCNEYGSPV